MSDPTVTALATTVASFESRMIAVEQAVVAKAKTFETEVVTEVKTVRAKVVAAAKALAPHIPTWIALGVAFFKHIV